MANSSNRKIKVNQVPEMVFVWLQAIPIDEALPLKLPAGCKCKVVAQYVGL